jgi:hypothetical protein
MSMTARTTENKTETNPQSFQSDFPTKSFLPFSIFHSLAKVAQFDNLALSPIHNNHKNHVDPKPRAESFHDFRKCCRFGNWVHAHNTKSLRKTTTDNPESTRFVCFRQDSSKHRVSFFFYFVIIFCAPNFFDSFCRRLFIKPVVGYSWRARVQFYIQITFGWLSSNRRKFVIELIDSKWNIGFWFDNQLSKLSVLCLLLPSVFVNY